MRFWNNSGSRRVKALLPASSAVLWATCPARNPLASTNLAFRQIPLRLFRCGGRSRDPDAHPFERVGTTLGGTSAGPSRNRRPFGDCGGMTGLPRKRKPGSRRSANWAAFDMRTRVRTRDRLKNQSPQRPRRQQLTRVPGSGPRPFRVFVSWGQIDRSEDADWSATSIG
jgi:hypothetical protein